MEGCQEEFNKSFLLNRGVHLSRASKILLHDADILIPRDYLKLSLSRIDRGYEAVRPLRFLFYANRADTENIYKDRSMPKQVSFESIAQNSQGGSTMILKQSYCEIGGHDESFSGWGGEDLEFLERLRTRKLFRGGFMPAIHLWHPPAQKKSSGHRNGEQLAELRRISPLLRIAELKKSDSRWEYCP
jgi:predicted glycosyltransferase involved in capsule biosynthesis